MSWKKAGLVVPILKQQRAGSSRLYRFDVANLALQPWQPAMSVASLGVVRPTDRNLTGFAYQASAAGQTGPDEPGWPRTAGGTVVDGSVTWTAVTPPASGEDSIASVVLTQVQPPDGTLTIANPTGSGLIASALIGGGTSGYTYTVNVAITMVSGAVYIPQLMLTIL